MCCHVTCPKQQFADEVLGAGFGGVGTDMVCPPINAIFNPSPRAPRSAPVPVSPRALRTLVPLPDEVWVRASWETGRPSTCSYLRLMRDSAAFRRVPHPTAHVVRRRAFAS